MQVDLFRNAQATDAVAALNHASMVSTVLEKIAASSVQRAAALPAVTRAEFDAAELERRQHFAAVGIDGNALAQRYGVFSAALRLPGRRVILEIKAASPSKGVMKTAIDLDDYAKVYGTYADAISVLTEPEFFRGSFERLAAVRERTTRPLLAKDFIVSDRQLLAAYRCGADAVLLMLSVLAPDGYRDLAAKAKALGLEVLTEASSVEEARVALELGAKIIGINNRNLRTLEVDVNRAPNVASELTGDLPEDVVLVAESGYTSFTAIAKAVAAAPRLNAFLCGSALSQASNLSLAVRELLFGHSKVCGITRPEDAMAAAEAGGSTVGIILAARSKRCVVLSEAKRLAKAIRDNAQRFQLPVAICAVIDAAELSQIPTILQTFAPERIQIHGTLSAEALENLVHSHPNTAFVPVIGVSIQCRRADETDAHLLRAVRSLLDAGAANVLLDAANPLAPAAPERLLITPCWKDSKRIPKYLPRFCSPGGYRPSMQPKQPLPALRALISIPALKRRRALNQPKKFIRPLPLSAAFLRRSLTTDCESSSIQNSHLQRTVHHEAQPLFRPIRRPVRPGNSYSRS